MRCGLPDQVVSEDLVVVERKESWLFRGDLEVRRDSFNWETRIDEMRESESLLSRFSIVVNGGRFELFCCKRD